MNVTSQNSKKSICQEKHWDDATDSEVFSLKICLNHSSGPTPWIGTGPWPSAARCSGERGILGLGVLACGTQGHKQPVGPGRQSVMLDSLEVRAQEAQFN